MAAADDWRYVQIIQIPNMITLLVIAGAILLISAIVLSFCVFNAPDGHEDEAGFHAEARDGSFWDHAKLGSASREPHGLHR